MQCTTPQAVEKTVPAGAEVDNRYDSEFPSKSVSEQLDFVSSTIKKLEVLVFYKTYIFSDENTLDENSLSSSEMRSQSVSNSVSNESVFGTATVVYFDGQKVGLLTCAHVIYFPDTIIQYYDDGEGPISSISVKVRQQNSVLGLPDGGDVKILATDQIQDIAFLSKELDNTDPTPKVLNYPIGDTKDLEWGSIVYVMGYPGGQKMVTRALVSNPKASNKSRFMTDALYNRGISGAPVLAIRDGMPNFEWVGMATSAAVNKIYFLKPGVSDPGTINRGEAYSGDLHVDHVNNINYGVTFNVKIEAIDRFLRDNRQVLERNGFVVDRMFK